MSFLEKTQKLFYKLFSSKRAVFAVFLAVLVLGVSSHVAFASVVLTQAQKDELKREWKATDAQITEWANKYNDYNTVRQTAIEAITPPGDPTDPYTPVTVATGKSASEIAGGGIDTLASMPVIAILHVIAAFCKMLVMFAARVVDVTLDPSLYNFTGSDFIKKGWVVVRDICNLFFLLALLFIAICTILKIDKYHAKKTLLTLIIMALLINFSKPIAIFIFDGSQLLMNFFLSQMTGGNQTASAMYSQASRISQMVYGDQTFSLWGGSGIAIKLLFSVVFLFMYAVALLVLAIFLLIRIVAVMLLIIVSPLAFFAAIIPDFSNMSTKWWKSLFEYSYYGPAAAFFILLGTGLTTALPRFKLPSGAADSNLTLDILQYLVVLIFLYASIIMAKQFGGGAGAAIVGNANKFMKWGAGWTKTGGMWGGIARGTGAADVYKGVRGGIAQRKGIRFFTKEGREIASKEREERWKGKIAPFSIATIKKKAKERENDAKENILRDAAKGDAAAILEASRRGIDTEKKDLWMNPNIIKALGNNDLREAAYGNLRDKGKTHNVIAAEIARQNIATDEAKVKELYNTELGKLSANNLGKQDLGELSKPDLGKTWVQKRLKDFDDSDPRLVSNMLSGGHANNIGFIRDLRTGGVLRPAQNSGNPQRQNEGRSEENAGEKIEVVRERSPRSRTTYDANGNPIT